jgi:HEAT repeat protein
MRTPKKKFDKSLDALDALRGAPATPETVAALKKALADRNNYIVAKAARLAGEQGSAELIPDLLSALDRFFEDPVKKDPQCWAKSAIFKALSELGHDDADVFLRGLTYVQTEPVWGGQQDMAGGVRGQCAAALVGCRSIRDVELLKHLVELLVDPDKAVRVEAARAVGRIARPESSLLLRLRALTGDEEPEVAAACFKALLEIEGSEAIPFVAKFLARGGEAAEEAALALGETHSLEALAELKNCWEDGRDRSLQKVLIAAIALTRLEEAIRFLAQIIRTGPLESAQVAVRAVADARVLPEWREVIAAAVEDRGEPRPVAP